MCSLVQQRRLTSLSVTDDGGLLVPKDPPAPPPQLAAAAGGTAFPGPAPSGGPAGDAGARHAVHYLAGEVRSPALQTVLDRTAALLDFPFGFVTVLDTDSLHTLVATGTSRRQTVGRAGAPCDEVVRTGAPLLIGDLLAPDHHRASHPAPYPVPAGVRAYLGVPLHGREGTVIGSLCLMDPAPRALTPEDSALLTRQAEVVEDHLDLHRRRSDLHLVPTGPTACGPAGRDPRAEAGPGPARGPRPLGAVSAAADLRRGLRAGEIEVHYEPVVELATGTLSGFEALARWQHPRRGLLAPAAFIPLAEDSDLILELDLVVLDGAVRQLRRWQRRRPGLRMNVNLSARHLQHPECVARILDVVAGAGVAPQAVGLEITESALIDLTPCAVQVVQDLRREGFQVLFDDFGTGWASLAYLLHLSADGVKIDRMFTSALSTSTGSTLVRAVLALTAELGLRTVVEGVSTAAELRRTRELGCDLAQGHFLGLPLPAGAVTL